MVLAEEFKNHQGPRTRTATVGTKRGDVNACVWVLEAIIAAGTNQAPLAAGWRTNCGEGDSESRAVQNKSTKKLPERLHGPTLTHGHLLGMARAVVRLVTDERL